MRPGTHEQIFEILKAVELDCALISSTVIVVDAADASMGFWTRTLRVIQRVFDTEVGGGSNRAARTIGTSRDSAARFETLRLSLVIELVLV